MPETQCSGNVNLSLSAAVKGPEVGNGLGLLKVQRKDYVADGVAHWLILHCYLLRLNLRAVGALADFLAGMGCDT